jgi:hypothetical protein
MEKKILWMLISPIDHPDICSILPSVAWMAKSSGAEFECYLESERKGFLFAPTGSTVIGGHHYQQFNYLNLVFDISYILLGEVDIFLSSIRKFEGKILAQANSSVELYKQLLLFNNTIKEKPQEVVFLPFGGSISNGDKEFKIGPYLFPEIYYRRALAFSTPLNTDIKRFIEERKINKISFVFLPKIDKDSIRREFPNAGEIDRFEDTDNYSTITLRIAKRWQHLAKGVAFGDPHVILSLIPTCCREDRIALFGELKNLHPSRISVSVYAEEASEIADDTARLAQETGNRILIGRQTGDGDLFTWSKYGVCLQIVDPNRPPFQVVKQIPHIWLKREYSFCLEPDDTTLSKWAKEGKILATLIFHSGEIAHNEAMLNLFDLVNFTGIKIGIAVHAQRYETCPQLWELINIPKEKGGVFPLVEPVLHSGGLGVLAEVNCPPSILEENCKEALKRIYEIAGERGTPKGYYAFMDAELQTLNLGNPEIYNAVENSGLEYFISSAMPGRNKILKEGRKMIVINQTCRSIAGSSPFVRITTMEEIYECAKIRPGWIIATLDSPVTAFNPYIWRYGSRFMKIVDWLKNTEGVINTTPLTIARYARILKREGFLPGK